MESILKPYFVQATTLPDLWFQANRGLFEHGRKKFVDKGSYEGDYRLEYDWFVGHILNPSFGSGTIEIFPQIPALYGIPNPVDPDYVYGGEKYPEPYLGYVFDDGCKQGESYTYGERLRSFSVPNWLVWLYRFRKVLPTNITDVLLMDNSFWKNPLIVKRENNKGERGYFIDQVRLVIETYKKFGFGNNQMVLQVAIGSDSLLKDPPCLRHIDTRIEQGKLHFFIYFRSWELWTGLPSNLAAIQFLQAYMAQEIGVEPGEMIVSCKGLHLYSWGADMAEIRCMVEDFSNIKDQT
ncbi:thymidylate synthase [Patescibacteria group bacterium]|nr:thymidylate synthase [Patescibacteria group bacterium]